MEFPLGGFIYDDLSSVFITDTFHLRPKFGDQLKQEAKKNTKPGRSSIKRPIYSPE